MLFNEATKPTLVQEALYHLQGHCAEYSANALLISPKFHQEIILILSHVKYVEFSRFTSEVNVEVLWSKYMLSDYSRNFLNSAAELLQAVAVSYSALPEILAKSASINSGSRYDELSETYFTQAKWANLFTAEPWLLILYLLKLGSFSLPIQQDVDNNDGDE